MFIPEMSDSMLVTWRVEEGGKGSQKFKRRSIRTQEIDGVRLQEKLYVHIDIFK